MPRISEKFFCGAKCRTKNGAGCTQPAMKNGRCKMHGGTSTGPKTREGKVRAARANFKHGLYTDAAIMERRKLRKMIKQWCDDNSDVAKLQILS
jgi:hypothetical protein